MIQASEALYTSLLSCPYNWLIYHQAIQLFFFFLAWQKNVFPPLLPIVPTPCGTFYKGPTRPLLSIGKSIIKDSVNMNVARIHILFKNQWSWSFVFEVGTQNRNYPQRDWSSQTILLTFWQSFWECVIVFKVFCQREKQVDQSNSCKKWTALKKKKKTTWCANTAWGKKGKKGKKKRRLIPAQLRLVGRSQTILSIFFPLLTTSLPPVEYFWRNSSISTGGNLHTFTIDILVPPTYSSCQRSFWTSPCIMHAATRFNSTLYTETAFIT